MTSVRAAGPFLQAFHFHRAISSLPFKVTVAARSLALGQASHSFIPRGPAVCSHLFLEEETMAQEVTNLPHVTQRMAQKTFLGPQRTFTTILRN